MIERIALWIILVRLAIACSLMIAGVLMALYSLAIGQIFIGLCFLVATAFLAGWPAGGIIKALNQLKERNRH